MAAKHTKLMVVDKQSAVAQVRRALFLGDSWRVEPWTAALVGAGFDHIVVMSFASLRASCNGSIVMESCLKDFIAQLRCRLNSRDGTFEVLP
jgi:hypothetical protein